MDTRYIQHIAVQLSLTEKQVNSVSHLHSEGSTIPFMARYRKEATGNLDEVAIGNIVDQLKYFSELEKRKETVIKTIEEAGKMTDALRLRIDQCINATELEDIYLPYKPKRKTRASMAAEKGLTPLAEWLMLQQPGNINSEATKYINEQVKDIEEALQGAKP
jgi:protein Tex